MTTTLSSKQHWQQKAMEATLHATAAHERVLEAQGIIDSAKKLVKHHQDDARIHELEALHFENKAKECE